MIKGVVTVFGVVIVIGVVLGALLLLARALGFVRFQFRRGESGGKLYSLSKTRSGGGGDTSPPPGA